MALADEDVLEAVDVIRTQADALAEALDTAKAADAGKARDGRNNAC